MKPDSMALLITDCLNIDHLVAGNFYWHLGNICHKLISYLLFGP